MDTIQNQTRKSTIEKSTEDTEIENLDKKRKELRPKNQTKPPPPQKKKTKTKQTKPKPKKKKKKPTKQNKTKTPKQTKH